MSIYLDGAATTKPKKEVVEAMMPYLIDKWQNPSALYNEARKIKKDIEDARATIGRFINANGNEIFFTSSGSESNCWAIQGFVNHCIARGKNPCVITSVIEHKSVIECVDHLNVNVHYIGVDKNGFINIAQLRNMLFHAATICEEEVLVSIQFANNEIGTIQHIKEIAEEVHRFGGVFHTDAVQAFGHIQIDVKDLDVDMLTASGHKVGCPKGIGILYKKDSVVINPLIYGSQMDGMRGGTENVPYIIGMAKAVELLQEDDEYQLRMTILRNNFISQLKSLGCSVNGSIEERLCNNINITFFNNISGEAMVYMLDLCGICVATGSACNSHEITSSYVLKAIGLSDEDASKTIRITLPDDITMDEIDEAVQEIAKQITLLSMDE